MKAEIEKGLALREKWASLREEVFIKEQKFEEEFDEIDSIAWHLVLSEEGVPVATARLFPCEEEEGTYIIGRVAVKKSFRGRSLGAQAVERMVEKAKELGAVRCKLAAQVRAKAFYEKIGFSAYGAEFYEEYCPHVWMQREIEK